ncbi:hypothetical protein TSUD_78570 [Trifolium subterraneum]|uniref:Uncharacterized protein n=1 Tax=Trifolium subterraneum TaxID=3900 RepID=A0A2Z6LTA6_TRISU|nr:hypothetical protein TSUD_78570 [Trifolium subterraneum]
MVMTGGFSVAVVVLGWGFGVHTADLLLLWVMGVVVPVACCVFVVLFLVVFSAGLFLELLVQFCAAGADLGSVLVVSVLFLWPGRWFWCRGGGFDEECRGCGGVGSGVAVEWLMLSVMGCRRNVLTILVADCVPRLVDLGFLATVDSFILTRRDAVRFLMGRLILLRDRELEYSGVFVGLLDVFPGGLETEVSHPLGVVWS